MICDEVSCMLGAYVDKELELTRQPDLEKHLAGCPSCQAAAEEIKNFSSLILMNIPLNFPVNHAFTVCWSLEQTSTK
jgi:hypothetical protein